MRLGSWPCVLAPGSLAHEAYRPRSDPRAASPSLRVQQRLSQALSRINGLVATGISPDGTIVEIMELTRSSLVPGRPVPPRVQVEADQGPSAVPRFHRRRATAAREPAGLEAER